MKISRFDKRFIILLLLIFLGVWGSSCASQTCTPEYIDQPTVTPRPSITPTQMPDYADWEGSNVEEGKFGRNDYCPVSFSYQSRTWGELTVAIGNKVSDSADADEIFGKIFQEYDQLIKNTLVNLQNPIQVFVIPDVSVENCTSYDAVVFTSPGKLDDILLAEDIIGASTGISEHWVRAGLAYLATEEEVDNQALKNWYQETEDLDILGLFVARFMTDWVSEEEVNIARMTSASILKYALEEENIPIESLGDRIDNDLRNRWLQAIGVDRMVNYPYDGLYEPFQFSHSEDCMLLLKSERMNFCLNRLAETPSSYFDDVADAEDLIYRAYNGYQAITDYLLANAPSINALINSEETITIEVKKLDVMLGYTRGNTISVNNSAVLFDVLHEIVHTYEWNEKLHAVNGNLLLSEGFAEYLGKLLPIYEQTVKKAIWDDLNGWEWSPGISAWYCLDEEQLFAAKEWYLRQGGSLADEEAIDPRLFYDAIAFATMYRNAHDGPLGISIEEKYTRLTGRDYYLSDMEGLELNYTQAASYAAWLCDTYSMDTVMDKYVNNADDTALEGKNFETLKAEWLAYLREKGEGIPIPDSELPHKICTHS
jgi:hypothetical protein